MDQILISPERCLGCRSCELACAVEHFPGKDLFLAVAAEEPPVARIFVETDGKTNFPMQCRHCQQPQCVNACMTGALRQDNETGKVIFGQDKCVGCWMCVMACPFGVIVQDWRQRVALKCDRCPDRDVPACAAACPTGAIRFMPVPDYSKEKRQRYLTMFVDEEGQND
ncbi:4Fe-4S dicluster domain-containing protein [Calderihabitans maritimus]|uniref:4Fe-4S ferredoxin n=1 Tax=Calderihabitans maritimus TaxID=1246530 RepID=A0A1Z5HS12_9FIRM|nr:4Fe-4S dicluster domain-containing protein [Calderihabitans maritimus]GAW92304.1 4Fe-4S ferredoxin [Calderihabitans maritimus]